MQSIGNLPVLFLRAAVVKYDAFDAARLKLLLQDIPQDGEGDPVASTAVELRGVQPDPVDSLRLRRDEHAPAVLFVQQAEFDQKIGGEFDREEVGVPQLRHLAQRGEPVSRPEHSGFDLFPEILRQFLVDPRVAAGPEITEVCRTLDFHTQRWRTAISPRIR